MARKAIPDGQGARAVEREELVSETEGGREGGGGVESWVGGELGGWGRGGRGEGGGGVFEGFSRGEGEGLEEEGGVGEVG